MRRETLRAYFMEVIRDLVTRGIVKRQAGQSLEETLKQELPKVLQELQADVFVVAAEMGSGLVQGLIGAGMRWLSGR